MTSNEPLVFGYPQYHTAFFGALDEVAIYDRVLGAGEIAELAGGVGALRVGELVAIG